MTFYKSLLSPATVSALDQLHKEQNTTGTTPEDDLDVLAALVVTSHARRILQFGTFLGGSALVLADLAGKNGEGAALTTVDSEPAMNLICKEYAQRASLLGMFTLIDGYSTDPVLIKSLSNTEWDVIYLDTTHQFSQTLQEIESITPICGPSTLFLFHDASAFAADSLDVGHQGGVRRAMREYCLTHPRWQWFIFEKPAFGQYGIGMMQKRIVQ